MFVPKSADDGTVNIGLKLVGVPACEVVVGMASCALVILLSCSVIKMKRLKMERGDWNMIGSGWRSLKQPTA